MWLAAAAAVIAGAVPAVADAGGGRSVDITQTVAVLSTEVGGTVVNSAGANDGSPGGRGAVRGRTTVENGVFRTVFTNYYAHGTIRAVSDLTRQEQPDGSTTFTGTGTFTGGTGRYDGARGRYDVTATVPPSSIVGTFRLRGRISY
jgi:hypothetical protein